MNPNRRIAVVAGVLWVLATVADLISRVVLVQPILGAPDYLTKISANENQVLLGALFLFIGAVAASGIAIALYHAGWLETLRSMSDLSSLSYAWQIDIDVAACQQEQRFGDLGDKADLHRGDDSPARRLGDAQAAPPGVWLD
jgi:hypothetical protein